MPRSYRQFCALARALDAVGDRWSMLIVRNLLLGPLRWSDLRDGLPGVPKNLLSARLSQLATDGIVQHEGELYALTPRGAALQPALFALADWGEAHAGGPPRKDDALRLRYLMTSMRRRIRSTAAALRLQLWVDGAPYWLRLGPAPTVQQGESDADAVARTTLPGLLALLSGSLLPADLVASGAVDLHGHPDALRLLVAAWPR